MLSKVTMILRGHTYEEVQCVAEVLLESEFIRNMEITLNTENAISIISRISKQYGNRLNVGAGTVRTLSDLILAHKAGASFVLSPSLMSEAMIKYCKMHGIISIPGAFSPTEVVQAFTLGADVVKIFPANELSYSYASKIAEPLGKLALMAVGGVNKSNVKEVLNSGYAYVGSAGGIFSKSDIREKNRSNLRLALLEFESAMD